jgi:hypothetical protein
MSVVRENWITTDRVLCSYAATIGGRSYTAQRTHLDTVSVWHGAEKIGVAPNPATWREDAWRIASEHAAKTSGPVDFLRKTGQETEKA